MQHKFVINVLLIMLNVRVASKSHVISQHDNEVE